MKICNKCAQEKPFGEFYQQKLASGNFAPMSICKDCQKQASIDRINGLSADDRAAYYLAMRNRYILRKYGLTPEQYDELLLDQGGVCKICRRPEISVQHSTGVVRLLAVDHDHSTGEVRGLLCMMCNTRIGYFEKYDLVDSLLSYLKLDGALR